MGIDGLGIAITPISISYRPYSVKRVQPTKHQFYRRSKKMAPFYLLQILREVGYPHVSYLFLKMQLSFLHIHSLFL
jgi:hypothetical protein